MVGPNTFCPISWMCKKQGAVSHSSSESEVIALDAGTRLEGIPCFTLWETVIDVMCPMASERGATRCRQDHGSNQKSAPGSSQKSAANISHAKCNGKVGMKGQSLFQDIFALIDKCSM